MEATHAFLTEGVSINYDMLTEANKEGLKQRIKNFFERIKKWVKSIIAKIKINIDRHRMTGLQFYERYKDSPGLTGVENKNLKFSGYKMDNLNPFDLKSVDASSMIKSVFSIDPPAKGKAPNTNHVKAISEDNASDRQVKLAKAFTGKSLGDSWKDELNKEAFGEKIEFKYGEGMFTKDKVIAQLKSDAGYREILKSYEAMEKAIQKAESDMNTAVDNIKNEYKEDHKKADGDKLAEYKEENDVYDYCTKYLGLYQEATNVLQSIQAIRTKYQEVRMNQAKRMFQMMITGKIEKKATEDFDIDAVKYDFDF